MVVNEMDWTYVVFEQLIGSCPDAAVLRRWVTAAFPDRPLLHQHEPGGNKPIYQYPLVQYKLIDGLPIIYGIGEGAEQVHEICEIIKCEDIRLGPQVIRDIRRRDGRLSITESESRHYRFISPWLAFNKKNYRVYKECANWAERKKMLNAVLVGNMISMAKALMVVVDFTVRVRTKLDIVPFEVPRHNLIEHGFLGIFEANLELPPLLGLGRHVSLGYGTVVEEV